MGIEKKKTPIRRLFLLYLLLCVHCFFTNFGSIEFSVITIAGAESKLDLQFFPIQFDVGSNNLVFFAFFCQGIVDQFHRDTIVSKNKVFLRTIVDQLLQSFFCMIGTNSIGPIIKSLLGSSLNGGFLFLGQLDTKTDWHCNSVTVQLLIGAG